MSMSHEFRMFRERPRRLAGTLAAIRHNGARDGRAVLATGGLHVLKWPSASRVSVPCRTG